MIDYSKPLVYFPLIERLRGSSQADGDGLDQMGYTHCVASLLIRAGRISRAAGKGGSVGQTSATANPVLILTEIEKLLECVVQLIAYAEAQGQDSE